MLSGNEIERLKSLRGKLAVLCPETDGLQDKNRIRYKPEDTSHPIGIEDILDIEAEIVLPGVVRGPNSTTQRISRLISLIYSIDGFSQEKIYHTLCSKRFKNRDS